jgi:hypothetical protein
MRVLGKEKLGIGLPEGVQKSDPAAISSPLRKIHPGSTWWIISFLERNKWKVLQLQKQTLLGPNKPASLRGCGTDLLCWQLDFHTWEVCEMCYLDSGQQAPTATPLFLWLMPAFARSYCPGHTSTIFTHMHQTNLSAPDGTRVQRCQGSQL